MEDELLLLRIHIKDYKVVRFVTTVLHGQTNATGAATCATKVIGASAIIASTKANHVLIPSYR
jgi:hypothetical protein